jgi:hypothetical protein
MPSAFSSGAIAATAVLLDRQSRAMTLRRLRRRRELLPQCQKRPNIWVKEACCHSPYLLLLLLCWAGGV